MSLTPSFAPELFRRHAFVWLKEGAEAFPDSSGDAEVLHDWIGQGLPLIVRRPCVSDAGEIFLGLSLPGKHRIACRAPRISVHRIESPPLCSECGVEIHGLSDCGVPIRVFGSRAWQHLTELSYIREDSDIDLLAEVESREVWRSFLTALQSLALPDSPRLDLEVVFQGDASFSWREFTSSGEKMLVKSNRSVWLQSKDRVEELFP
jgi:phosphoribosyl-dephospho-CoA transferase